MPDFSFNPFYKVTAEKHPLSRIYRRTLWEKFLDTFFVMTGKSSWMGFLDDDAAFRGESAQVNHAGLADYVTLFLHPAMDSLATYCTKYKDTSTAASIFFWPAAFFYFVSAGVNAIIGGALTLLASPLVAVTHLASHFLGEPAGKLRDFTRVEKSTALITSHTALPVFPRVPKFVNMEIFSYLDEASLSRLAISNKTFGHSFYQTNRIKTKLSQHLAANRLDMVDNLLKINNIRSRLPFKEIKSMLQPLLFTLAGNGEQDKLETILKIYPECLLTSAPLKDISGVELVIDGKKGITLFQHAIWARDVRYMCNMMLDCLPKTKEGEEIRLKLLEQCNELMEKGVVYELNGKTQREKQFSLKPLTLALQTYIDNLEVWSEEERKEHWCKVVGLAQTLLPANVRQHYCDPEESFEKPDFKKPKFKRCIEFYNDINDKTESWGSSLAGLGINFGIGAGWPGGAWGRGRGWAGASDMDLAAITALDEVRTNDLKDLIQRLQSPLQILEENQAPIFGNY